MNEILRADAAEELVDQIDLAALGACPACLFELAWAVYQGRPPDVRAHIARRTARDMWWELDEALRAAVVELRMREVPGAEEGLRDLAERGMRATLFRVVIERLAQEMAAEIASAKPTDM